ncbi:hypothetical protein TrST_g5494 [Triparma strigata]|uniref:Uncharacterized protein n=1 Tax=Triparma strigata TaxID=1606541 RepID=A0A9W7A3X3_9STRA|nr:hypothetical protein TrST_g5494 [Triparma strigata]
MKIADETTATKNDDRAFRRASISAGIETSLILPPMQTSNSSLATITDSQIKGRVQDMLLFVQGSKNILHQAKEFVADNFASALDGGDLHAAVEYQQRFIEQLMIEVKPILKFARWGATGRVLLVLILTYSDMITDLLVSFEYYNGGNIEGFWLSIGILAFATLAHATVAWAKTLRKGFVTKVKSIIAALCLLSPAIESYDYWRGKLKEDDDVLEPVLFLVGTRAIELVLESVPESAIQLTIFFKTENPTDLMKFSIFSSICAAGFIMADTNISYERGKMNAQSRGVGTHPQWGMLPSKPALMTGTYIGYFMFHVCYLTTGVLALVGSMLCFQTYYIFGVIFTEFLFILSHRWQYYSTRETGREHIARFMTGEFLTYNYKSVDEQAFSMVVGVHPAFTAVSTTADWLLTLNKTSSLFEGDSLPKSMGAESGLSFEKSFEKLDYYISYHIDRRKSDEEKAKLLQTKEHLAALREEVIEQGLEHKKAAEEEARENAKKKKRLSEMRKLVNLEHVQELEARLEELERELSAYREKSQ